MLFLLIVSLLWAFSFGLIKTHLTTLDSSFVAALRMLLCLLVFAPLLRLGGVRLRLGLTLVGIGALQFGLMYLAYIESYQYLKSYEVALLTVFTPLWMTLLNSTMRRELTLRFHAAAALAIAGALVIVWRGLAEGPALKGVLILQVANLAFASGQLLYKRTRERHPKLRDHEVFGLLYLGAALLTWAVVALRVDFAGLAPSPVQWLVLVYLGVVASGLGFFLWNLGATRVSVGALAVMNNGYMPFAVLASVLLFGEEADWGRLLPGSALIVAGLWLCRGGAYPVPGNLSAEANDRRELGA
ncbi:MAG: EamA family transporter [Planctomycetota bacterium]|nr:MAG: EamA family transporter [Planctomycetota bacterium]